MIKKILVVTLIFMLLFAGICTASSEFYGTVYIFDTPLQTAKNYWYLNYLVPQKKPVDVGKYLNLKPIVLLNKGTVKSVNLILPYDLSNIEVEYEGRLYKFPLKFYKKHNNCLIYVFVGGRNGK